MKRHYLPVVKMLLVIIGAILACRFTEGYAIVAIPIVAMGYIAKKKSGHVLLCFMFIPFLCIVSGRLVGQVWGPGARGAIVFMMVLMAGQASARKGPNSLSVGFLYLYLTIAIISSLNGWCPLVSCLKIINFFCFLTAVYLGTRNLHHHPEELAAVRTGMLAFAVFVIVGSVASIPFPSVSYSMMVAKAMQWGSMCTAEEIAANIVEVSGIKLFSGVLNHSQTFSPCAVSLFVWVLCDMLFVERRADVLHLVLLGLTPVLLFMSRSRVGLLSFIFSVSLVYFIALPKARLSQKIKSKFMMAFICVFVLSVAGALTLELRDQTFSRWIRKTEDVASDQRSLSEAVTDSRMGKVDMNLEDFNRNPMFGMGFQVESWHQAAIDSGRMTIYSAPIEKGVLPLMVLGETGVAGAIVFAMFLVSFYGTCVRKRFNVTLVMFSVMLSLNMAEATFFSPGGAGGVFWIICVVGGFTIDMIIADEKSRSFLRQGFGGE